MIIILARARRFAITGALLLPLWTSPALSQVIDRGTEGKPLSEIRPAPKSIYPDQKVITAERNRVPGIRAKFADHFYAREQSMMTDYFRGFALAGLISTPDPRETARLFAAGLIYIRLEHYVMGAAPSPRPKVIEAIDRYLAFFLSLIAAGDDDGNKKRKTKGETRGKAAPD